MTLRSAILASLVALAGGPGAGMVAAADSRPAATWVVTPSQPGGNLPPIGRSLFEDRKSTRLNSSHQI